MPTPRGKFDDHTARAPGGPDRAARVKRQVQEGYIAEQREAYFSYVYSLSLLPPPHAIGGGEMIRGSEAEGWGMDAANECEHGWLPMDGEARRPEGCACGAPTQREPQQNTTVGATLGPTPGKP